MFLLLPECLLCAKNGHSCSGDLRALVNIVGLWINAVIVGKKDRHILCLQDEPFLSGLSVWKEDES